MLKKTLVLGILFSISYYAQSKVSGVLGNKDDRKIASEDFLNKSLSSSGKLIIKKKLSATSFETRECSATLVGFEKSTSSQFLITAAHCLFNSASVIDDPKDVKFILNYNKKFEKTHEVSEIYISPQYSKNLIKYKNTIVSEDWALLKLTKKIANQKPAILTSIEKYPKGLEVTSVGYPFYYDFKSIEGKKLIYHSGFAIWDSSVSVMLTNTEFSWGQSGGGVIVKKSLDEDRATLIGVISSNVDTTVDAEKKIITTQHNSAVAITDELFAKIKNKLNTW